jgi:hypothetical protein
MPQLAKNATLKWPLAPEPAAKAPKRRKSKARKRSPDPTEGLQVANPNAAAIDIGRAERWVSVPAGRAPETTRA